MYPHKIALYIHKHQIHGKKRKRIAMTSRAPPDLFRPNGHHLGCGHRV